VATVTIALFCGTSVLVAQDRPHAAAYAVYPIVTDLQKSVLFHNAPRLGGLRAYMAIDGDSLIDNEGRFDATALNVDAIRNSLAPHADRSQGSVVIQAHFGTATLGTGQKLKSSTVELKSALHALGRTAGFRFANVAESTRGPTLDQRFSEVTDKVAGQADEDETPAGDDLVKVYPVRTILSLLLTENCDCVIDVRAPLQKEGDDLLTSDVRAAIVKHVSGLKLRHMDKTMFRIKSVTERVGQERLTHFLQKEAADLARSLGFKTGTVLAY
jgi:hypothetical protein